MGKWHSKSKALEVGWAKWGFGPLLELLADFRSSQGRLSMAPLEAFADFVAAGGGFLL